MAMRIVPYKYREPLTGALGAGTGLVVAELPAEYAVRVTGQTGYVRAGVKTLVKVAVGAILLGISGATRSPMWSLFAKVGAFAGMGSSLLDWIAAYYPGGIQGIAGALAVTTRTWTVGATRVAAEIARAPPIAARTPTVSRSKY